MHDVRFVIAHMLQKYLLYELLSANLKLITDTTTFDTPNKSYNDSYSMYQDKDRPSTVKFVDAL